MDYYRFDIRAQLNFLFIANSEVTIPPPANVRIDPRVGMAKAGIPINVITVPIFSAMSHDSNIRFAE
ncbi:MAG: hypothetical protein HXS54_10795 [Theionarchaea archaeon]|nr:hypothetical protein [Theionarchaea archaeon]